MVEAGQVPAELSDELGRTFWMGHNNLAWRDMHEGERVDILAAHLQTQENATKKKAAEAEESERKRLASQPTAPANDESRLVTHGHLLKCCKALIDGIAEASREALKRRDARIDSLEKRLAELSEQLVASRVANLEKSDVLTAKVASLEKRADAHSRHLNNLDGKLYDRGAK